MSQATEPREADGVAEARAARRKLTNSVGTTLAPRSKPSNGKLSTWKERLGMRKASA
jgi:hypothetical protein